MTDGSSCGHDSASCPRRVGPDVPAVYAADPDASGHLEPLVVAVDGTHATVHLPPLATWQMIVVRSR